MLRTRIWTLAAAAGFALAPVGCSGNGTTDVKTGLTNQANGKVAAIKELATALDGKPDAGAIAGYLDSIMNNNLDAKAYPEQAKEFLEIYNTKIKGKLKGDAATQMKGMAEAVEKDLGK